MSDRVFPFNRAEVRLIFSAGASFARSFTFRQVFPIYNVGVRETNAVQANNSDFNKKRRTAKENPKGDKIRTQVTPEYLESPKVWCRVCYVTVICVTRLLILVEEALHGRQMYKYALVWGSP